VGKWSRKLRIGEKIGFGFGVVGLLFLGVIWQYHNTLQKALADYRRLHDVYEARETQAQNIESSMLRAQHAEKRFALSRDEEFAEEVLTSIGHALAAARAMEAADSRVEPVAVELTGLINDYGRRFRDVVSAWRTKGLDHNSGLQGAFRDSVHELEDMAGQLKVDRLYLLLLQIRRGEKDLGLRREEQYRERVRQLIQAFSDEVAASGLRDGLKARLFHETAIYRDTFEQYAKTVLDDPQPHPGKGPFRRAAHRIEALLEAHYLSGLGESILQVRRREKDYLLRHDEKYVAMVHAELDRITAQVKTSAVAESDKARFAVLMDNYRRDFGALVDQTDRIDRFNREMMTKVSEIVELVEENVRVADEAATATRQRVEEVTSRNEQAMLWVVVLATLLGVVLAVTITMSIVRPLLRMAGLLDQLAAEEPAERVPFFSGGRDEVNAMAGSVNAMADHKARFIDWWKATMREADACERLQELVSVSGDVAECTEARAELRESVGARKELLQEQYQNMHQQIDRIIERTETLLEEARPGSTEVALNTIRYSARSVQTLLLMASSPGSMQRTNDG
jgi:methyl-accepting chemotaxis protein